MWFHSLPYNRARLIFYLALTTLLLSACLGIGRSEEQSAPVDTGAIVDQVLAELDNRPSAPVAVHSASPQTVEMNLSLEERLIELYREANLSVVFIVAAPVGTGSGFVYDAQGHIVTNNHVVTGSRSLEVVFANGERRTAEIVGTDADADLAVIRVSDLPTGIGALALSASEVQVGQFVVAIGNPFGEQGSMSLGIVSGLGRSLPSQRSQNPGSTYSLPRVIQTDAPINPGNSGGPLLDLSGAVVGVNAAIATTSGANSGVGFSIPVEAVARIVPQLIDRGAYEYPYMGAAFDEEISLSEQTLFGLSQTRGAYVVNVTRGSPADRAGLIGANPSTGRGGDLIIAIDDVSIDDFQDLNAYLVFETEVGQEIQMTVLRRGQSITVPLILGARP